VWLSKGQNKKGKFHILFSDWVFRKFVSFMVLRKNFPKNTSRKNTSSLLAGAERLFLTILNKTILF
jgi:hypothetical protein